MYMPVILVQAQVSCLYNAMLFVVNEVVKRKHLILSNIMILYSNHSSKSQINSITDNSKSPNI